MGVKWYLAIFEAQQGGLWGWDRMSQQETVGDEVREKGGRQILHVGPENHCEDFGLYSECDGNPRKSDSFISWLLIFMFFGQSIGFSN